MRRYDKAPLIAGGIQYGTFVPNPILRAGVESGYLDCKKHILQEGERLDTIAGREYGDSSLWWVLAGASAIGWSLQVPPGTVIYIPTSLSQVSNLVS